MSRQTAIVLLGITVLGGAVRWVALEKTFPTRPMGDEGFYISVATKIATIGEVRAGEARASRPPAHPYLMSLLLWKPDWAADTEFALVSMSYARLAKQQVALGVLIVLLTGLLGRALFDDRIGALAAAMAALYPNLVAMSHYLWSENLYTVFLLLGLLLAVRASARESVVTTIAAGVVLGIGALARESTLLIAGACALWWIATAQPADRRAAWGRGALLCGVAALCVVPWTVRNYQLLGRVVPVATIGWFAAGEGNSLEESDWLLPWGPRRAAFKDRYFAIDDEIDQLEFARRYTLERVRAEQPTWILKKVVRNTAQLFAPNSSLIYKVQEGSYGDLPPKAVRLVYAVSAIPYSLVLLLGALGIAASRGRREWLLPCLVIGLSVAMHILTNATARFRIAWMPLFMIYASVALLGLRDLHSRMTRRRWLAWGFVCLAFFGLCVPYFFVYFA